MPEPKQTTELDQLAFEIFKTGVAMSPRPAEQWAIEAYRKAETFLAIRNKIQTGTVKAAAPAGPQLADACAPNLHKYHPINLISQRFGDLKKVSRIDAFLKNNKPSPTVDDPDQELLERVKREFADCESWDKPALATARSVFPAYTQPTTSSQ